jgi:hypothetical protein
MSTTLTPKQIAALHTVVRQVQEHFDVQIRAVEDLNIHHMEEFRQHRGHDIRFDYIDADYAVTGYMNPHGHTSLSVATVSFIHDSGDEECDCTLCADATA